MSSRQKMTSKTHWSPSVWFVCHEWHLYGKSCETSRERKSLIGFHMVSSNMTSSGLRKMLHINILGVLVLVCPIICVNAGIMADVLATLWDICHNNNHVALYTNTPKVLIFTKAKIFLKPEEAILLAWRKLVLS